ncbi:MAG TPA: substrate-binding domain-containing protein, partial [Micromonosporaceae bacterium]
GLHRKVHRSAGRRVLTSALVLVLVAGAGAGGWYGYRHGWFPHTGGCTTTTDLRVAAAPEIAPAVSSVAAGWNAKKTEVDGECVRVTVAADQPSAVAAAVAGAKDVTVTGLGKPNGTATVPDVWLPDSSTWLQRLGAAAPELAIKGTPVAASPIVVAMPQPVAASLGSKLASVSWSDLLGLMTGGQAHPGIVDPNADASGLLGLLGVGQATSAGGAASTATSTTPANPTPQQQAALVGAMRALSGGDSLLRDDLMGQFPRATDASTIARSLSAAPVPEQSLLAFNAAQPPVPLVGLYLSPAPPALDYPYAAMPDLSSVKSAAAAQFGHLLSGAGWRDDLASADLRAPDGTYGAAMPQTSGMPQGPLAPSPVPAAAINQALSTWSAVTVPGRMLAVIDVSGSMTTKVPTAANASREAVTVAAAKAGLGLFDDRWSVGLWTFSTNMDGTKPYKQLAPIAPLASGRAAMGSALGTVTPIPNGDTGLYDTVLAAYKTVQAGWDPSRVNSVVIMTDGQNDNPGGLTLSALLADINKVKDPSKPIEVIAIGIGNQVDKAELQKITNATGGGVFLAPDPSNIGQIFLEAIALRPGSAK